MGGVFISYRRDDTQGSTGRIADRLHQLLGDEIPLFLDIDSIQPGQDFRDVISHTLAQCDVTLIMIGPRWLDVTDDEGNVRLTEESDLHRLEVESALSSSGTTIPVLVEGAVMPTPEELPESIRELAYLHAAEVSVRRFAVDASFLAESIRAVVKAQPEPAPVEHPTAPPEPVADVSPEPTSPPPSPPPVSTPAPVPTPAPGPTPDRAAPDRRVLAAGAVAVVLLVIGLVFALTGDGDDGDAPESTASTTADVRPSVNVFDLEVGDCFGEVDGIPVFNVEPLDCSGLHPNEVYAIWESFTTAKPTDDVLLDGCLARFDDVVGAPYNLSSYYVAGFWPDAETWLEGTRTVICYGFVRDGEGVGISTTGSMIGSGN